MLRKKCFHYIRYIQSNLWIKATQGKDGTWSLLTSGLYLEVTLFYFIKEGLLKCGLYLQGGLYSEVAFNTGLTVPRKSNQLDNLFASIHCSEPVISYPVEVSMSSDIAQWNWEGPVPTYTPVSDLRSVSWSTPLINHINIYMNRIICISGKIIRI